MKLTELSKKTGVATSTLSKIFNDKRRMTLNLARKIAPAMDTDVVSLMVNGNRKNDLKLASLAELLNSNELTCNEKKLVGSFVTGLTTVLDLELEGEDYPVAPDIVLSNQREPEIEPDSGYPIPPSIVLDNGKNE